jgi:hypothetical protein
MIVNASVIIVMLLYFNSHVSGICENQDNHDEGAKDHADCKRPLACVRKWIPRGDSPDVPT